MRHNFKPSAGKYAHNIIVEHKNHQQNQDKNTGLLGDLAHADVDGAPDDRLDEKKHQMTAIQNRNGQKIEHGQIDAQYGNEKDQVGEPRFGLLPGHFSDHDRSAQCLGGYRPLDQLADAQQGQPGDLVGLIHALCDRLEKPPFDGDAIGLGDIDARRGDADPVAVHLFPEHIFLAEQNRHDIDREDFFPADDPQRHRLAMALGDDRFHRVPAVYRFSVDGDDQIPWLHAGFFGRVAVGDFSDHGL